MTEALIEADAAAQKTSVPARRRARLNSVGVVSLAWLGVVVAGAIVGPFLVRWPPNEVNLGSVLQLPSASHVLGTDALGRDIMSRLVYGAEPSLVGVAIAVFVFAIVGVPLGMVAGYYGGARDAVVGRTSDILLSIPAFIIMLVVLAIYPANTNAAMATFGLLMTPSMIRVVRAVTRSAKEQLFVDAARVFGVSTPMIIIRHVGPLIRGTIIVQLALLAGIALGVQSGLAFLGFGPQAPNPSWGGMVANASAVLFIHPWEIVPPGLTIGFTILALNLLGNALRDASSESWSVSNASLLLPRERKASRTGKAPIIEAVVGSQPVLQVRGLAVSVISDGERRNVVRGVDLDVMAGEIVGIVGESGCGKTLTTLGILGALPPGAELSAGSVHLRGDELTVMSSYDYDSIRGKRIGYVSQEPMLALDPMFTVRSALTEAVHRNTGLSGRAAKARVLELLQIARVPDPGAILGKYPHQLSGGLAQRVSIALALSGDPELLIADEPTTALDVTTQAEILKLIQEIADRRGMATLLITHDWGVVASLCDRAIVMYAGQVVDEGPVVELFERPRHPYTLGLLGSNPQVLPDLGAQVGPARALDRLPAIPGDVPPPSRWGAGCTFAARCPFATQECLVTAVPLIPVTAEQNARCLHHAEVGWSSVERMVASRG